MITFEIYSPSTWSRTFQIHARDPSQSEDLKPNAVRVLIGYPSLFCIATISPVNRKKKAFHIKIMHKNHVYNVKSLERQKKKISLLRDNKHRQSEWVIATYIHVAIHF